MDDYSRFCTVFLMKQKIEAFHCFSVFAEQARNRFDRPITFFHSDNEIVLQSRQFIEYFEKNGIMPLYSCRYSPSQNGIAERMMLTLLNPVRSMLAESSFGKQYWCYSLLYAATTHNVSPTSATSMVPFEGWHLRVPSYDRLMTFGQRCVVTVPLIDRQKTGNTKLSRGVHGIFLGFAPNKKGYLIELESGKVIDCQYQDVNFISRSSKDQADAVVDKKPVVVNVEIPRNDLTLPTDVPDVTDLPVADSDSDELGFEDAQDSHSLPDENIESANGEQHVAEPGTAAASPRPSLDETTTSSDDSSDINSAVQHGTGIWDKWKWTTAQPKHAVSGVLPPGTKRSRPPVNYSAAMAAKRSAVFSAVVHRMHSAFASIDSIVQLSNHGRHQWYRSKAYSATVPNSYSDIASCDNPDEWFQAADEEISQLIKYGTWQLVPAPEGVNVMKNTWVFRIKEKDGVIVRYKARLCACGYSQIAGVDYKELFSPTIHASSFRLHLALIAHRKMVTKQMDVTGAFLNGDPEEVVHMQQPDGYVDPDHPDWVC